MSDDLFEASVRVAGLAHLLPKYTQPLRAAFESARKIRDGLVTDMQPAREPAMVFRLEPEE